jgi:hypothetical protein
LPSTVPRDTSPLIMSTIPTSESTYSTTTTTLKPFPTSIDSTLLTSSSTTLSSTTSTSQTTIESCCAVQQCTTDADCCIPSVDCQCYRHNQSSPYGSCLNPNVEPICGDGCPDEGICYTDTDCCKCQCGTITVSTVSGNTITKRQCIPR